MSANDTIDNREDYLDVRTIIDRVEHLSDQPPFIGPLTEEQAEDDQENDRLDDEEQEELHHLLAFLDELRGNGGDHAWEGDWYPVTLIRDSYWQDYAEEFAEDIGAIKPDQTWPYNCIDWERAALELQIDYTSAEFDGVTYWYR